MINKRVTSHPELWKEKEREDTHINSFSHDQ